jgi:hypothetical protein
MILVLLASLWLAQGLKHRTDTPKHPDHITILVMLAASQDRFHVGDSATLTGYVAGVRHEADGDWHIELANSPKANRAHSVVCEIVPTHPLKPPVKGKHVTITGWVYWDGHHLHEPGRGTLWEIHPVSSIKEAK